MSSLPCSQSQANANLLTSSTCSRELTSRHRNGRRCWPPHYAQPAVLCSRTIAHLPQVAHSLLGRVGDEVPAADDLCQAVLGALCHLCAHR